jgi:hypothetical protein
MQVQKEAWKTMKNTLLGASLLGMVVSTMITELVKLLLSTFQLQEKKGTYIINYKKKQIKYQTLKTNYSMRMLPVVMLLYLVN